MTSRQAEISCIKYKKHKNMCINPKGKFANLKLKTSASQSKSLGK